MRTVLKLILICVLVFLIGCQSKVDKIEQQARDLISLKNYDLAINLLEREVQNYPEIYQFHYLLGNCYANKYFETKDEQYKIKSINYFQSSIKLNNDHFQSKFNIASLRQEKNDWISLKLHQDNPDVSLNLGMILNDIDMIKKSMKTLPVEGAYEQLDDNDKNQKGTFIVKDSIEISLSNGKPYKMLNAGDVYSFIENNNERLFFYIDAPVKKYTYINPRNGYNGLSIFNEWKDDTTSKENILPTDPTPSHYLGDLHIYKKYGKYDKCIKYNPWQKDCKYVPGSIKAVKEVTSGLSRFNSKSLLVEYEYLEPQKAFANKDDKIIIGTGNIDEDRNRIYLISDLTNKLQLNKELKEKITNRFVSKNYPAFMIQAALGKVQEGNKYITDDGLFEEWVYKDKVLLTKNKRLISWHDKVT